MPEVSLGAENPQSRAPPLALPITVGMPVVVADDGLRGVIAGMTQAFCIYRLEHSTTLAVAPWSELALANIVPARSQLSADLTAIDRANASAALLRELLALRQFGLTDLQSATLEELLIELCRSSVDDT